MRFRLGAGLLLALALPGCDGCGRGTARHKTPPLAPDGLALSALSTTRVQATWNDLSDNEGSFIVQTSPDGLVWTEALRVQENVTAAVVPNLVPGVQVWIRVVSRNSGGQSPSAAAAVTPPLPAWSFVDNGPAPLVWSCAAYDPTRRWMLVFGGDDGSGHRNELWALDLDGTPPAWSEVMPALGNTPPAGRIGASLIYDPLGDRLILFGGQSGTNPSNAELWEFRMSTLQWFLLSPSGTPPAARQHHTAVYDDGLDRMVVFGGEDAASTLMGPELLSLNLSAGGPLAWSAFTLSGPAPTPRSTHTAIFDGLSRRMIVFAGRDSDPGDGSQNAQDVWTLDLSVASPTSWSPLTTSGGPPDFRYGHVAVWDSVNGQMVVFGGEDSSVSPVNDVWTLTLDGSPTWRRWDPLTPSPGPRQFGTAVFDPVLVRMLYFGGWDDFLSISDETWSLGL